MMPRSFIHYIGILSLILSLGQPSLPGSLTITAPAAQGFRLSDVIPGARLASGWLGRNRTYKSAEEFIRERNAYYDSLRTTLRKQLQERAVSKMRSSQLAAYIKEVSLIEGEREAALAFAEAIKKGARRDFTQAVKQELLNRLMSTGFMSQIFGAFKTGIDQAQGFLDQSLQEFQSTGSIGSVIGNLRNLTNQMNVAATLFGGSYGQSLRDGLEAITGRLEYQADLTQQQLNQVKTDLAYLQSKMDALQQRKRVPASSQVGADLALQLVGWGEETPETEAILNLLGRRSGLSSEQVRERGMALLQSGYIARCREKARRILEAIQQLENQDTTVNPQSLCNEIRGETLFATQANPTSHPDPEPDPEAGGDNRLRFQETDCPTDGLPTPQIQARSGVLSCSYSQDGPHGGTGQGFSIWEMNDPQSLAEQIVGGRSYAQTSEAFYAVKESPHLEVIQNDESGYVYMETYIEPGNNSPDQQNPLCGSGGGNFVVDDQYVIGINLSSCELGDDPQAYSRALQSLIEEARAALGQARGRPAP